MEKSILSARELAQVKRIAQNVDADFQKVLKLEAKIAELTSERDDIQKDIDEMEAPVMRKTGGYKSTDIYKKVIVPQFNENGTPKVDKDGRQIKVTKWALRYEDTIIPPVEKEPMFDEEPMGNAQAEDILADDAEVRSSSEVRPSSFEGFSSL